MDIKIGKFTRVPFIVEAVEVTEENIYKVAEWCNGEVRTSRAPGQTEGGKKFVKVNIKNPFSERQTRAFEGDWVLLNGINFRVYTASAFQKAFEPVENAQDDPEQEELDFNPTEKTVDDELNELANS